MVCCLIGIFVIVFSLCLFNCFLVLDWCVWLLCRVVFIGFGLCVSGLFGVFCCMVWLLYVWVWYLILPFGLDLMIVGLLRCVPVLETCGFDADSLLLVVNWFTFCLLAFDWVACWTLCIMDWRFVGIILMVLVCDLFCQLAYVGFVACITWYF